MEKKQKVKERHVGQLRKLIGAVAEQNGDEGILPKSFLPLRVIITVVSVAAVVCGVVVFGSMVVAEADLIHALKLVFSTRDSEALSQVGKVIFGLALHFGIMFAALAVVLYCCHRSVRWEWKQLVVCGNEEVATWKASPTEASREAVEALEAYLQEHAPLGKPSWVKETVEAAAISVGAAMENEAKKRQTSVESSRVHTLRKLLKSVLKKSGREELLPKSTYWFRIYVLVVVAIAGIVIGQLSGLFTYLQFFIISLVTLHLGASLSYLFFIWPLALSWGLVIAVFVAVLGWHRRETFKEWKALVELADHEVETWSQTAVVPDEVVELQLFLKKVHKYD